MAEINGRTLAMAIQAVDAMIDTLKKEFDAAEGIEARDLEDLLLTYMNTAADLHKGYEDECKLFSNLPRYDTLVRN